jgi:tRNA(His) guanylyltransferase
MYDSLGDRQKGYESAYDYELIRRIPLIVRVDGRSFHRVCKKLKKPYEPLLLEAMAQTMFFVVSEMAGAVFAYQQSDEITFVLRNDQSLDSEPWYGNRLQKICSITSSLATLGFNKSVAKLDTKLDLLGDALFDARVFGMPTVSEVVNNLVWRQQDCARNAVSGAAQAVLGKKFGKKTALKMLHGQTTSQKKDLLLSECGIDFDEEYPTSFRMGVAAYKVPMLMPNGSDTNHETRKKWTLDWEIPNFVTERDFIYNIIFSGHDVIREGSFATLSKDDNLMS